MWTALYIVGCIVLACCMAVGVYRYIMGPIEEEEELTKQEKLADQKLKTERANREAEKLVEMMNNKWKDMKINNLKHDIERHQFDNKNLFVVVDAVCRVTEGEAVDLVAVIRRYKETDTYRDFHQFNMVGDHGRKLGENNG